MLLCKADRPINAHDVQVVDGTFQILCVLADFPPPFPIDTPNRGLMSVSPTVGLCSSSSSFGICHFV